MDNNFTARYRQEFDVSHSSILKSYGVAVELMTQTDCFDAMLDVSDYAFIRFIKFMELLS